MEKHKCVDCGFLAKGHTFSEVNDQERRLEITSGASNILDRDSFVCAEGKMDFANETDPSGDAFPVLRARPVFQKERDCAAFRKWQRGFTPKEHREMMDREEWRKWQEKQRRDDFKWRIFELVVLVIGAGLFTLLGAWIQRSI